MEQPNIIPVVSKRIWNIVRAIFYMIRKGISDRKLMVDLKMMMKRGKIAGKAIHNLMFHHHHHHSNPSSSSSSSAAAFFGFNRRSQDGHMSTFPYGQQEYEFSCSNSPTTFPFHLMKRKSHHNSHFFPCAHAPQTADDNNNNVLTVEAVRRVLEMMDHQVSVGASPVTAMATPMTSFWQSPAARDLIYSELSSPALPGFGRTPMARQLRITDSPFPLRDADGGDCHVDQAAEAFILKFYNELKKQDKMTPKR